MRTLTADLLALGLLAAATLVFRSALHMRRANPGNPRRQALSRRIAQLADLLAAGVPATFLITHRLPLGPSSSSGRWSPSPASRSSSTAASDDHAPRPLWRRVAAALSGVKLPGRRYTGYGWSCPPCKINAGEPADPFPHLDTAGRGLVRHVNDSHYGIPPEGVWVGEITWRGHGPMRERTDDQS